MNETRIQQATPEQLIKLLDIELHTVRGRHTGDSGQRRMALVVGGLLFIVGACCSALLILQQMLSDLKQREVARDIQHDAPSSEARNY